MGLCRFLLLPAVWAVWAAETPAVLAAGRVELVLVSERGAPLMASQDWARSLSRAGVRSVQIRGRQPGDEIGIRTRGTSDRPTYLVTGVLSASNELLLPGGRFKRGDAARVARWLNELAAKGPPEERERKSAFGLTSRQFELAHEDLARPVDFSTKGLECREVVDKLAARLDAPLVIDRQMLDMLGRERVSTELNGLSCGTALAYTLRPPGLCLVPRPRDAEAVEYAIVAASPTTKVWPVGWSPDKPRRDVLPGLFEFLNVNIKGVSVSKVLTAAGERLKVPVLMDHNALARRGIEPEKIQVEFPQKRTTYSLLLRRVLFQARLKSELRVDEAGKPLLWITTLKPV